MNKYNFLQQRFLQQKTVKEMQFVQRNVPCVMPTVASCSHAHAHAHIYILETQLGAFEAWQCYDRLPGMNVGTVMILTYLSRYCEQWRDVA